MNGEAFDMCGIAGYISLNNEIIPDKRKVKKMTDIIAHRGPDAEGQWIDERVAFGHRRLSIIDLSENGNQPMVSSDKKYVITYNGEIYNYIELKNELEEMGAHFFSDSDTEVIIEAYRYWGINAFNRFNGMWAFALYDIENSEVILCRDRFGIKPLYYLEKKGIIVFASEIKSIFEVFPEEKIPDETSIFRYLSFSLKEDVDERTFYKNVKVFSPAKYWRIGLKHDIREEKAYWEIDEKLFYQKWIHGRNPITTFRNLFESAVGLRLRADVEVGACLSGGIDSSSIVGCVSNKYSKKIHTFSSIYDDEDCNEEEYIKVVNNLWKCEAHYIRPEEYEGYFVDYIKKIVYHHDQPIGGASLYSQYMVMNGVYGNVKVVLDGQGADELFAGYIRYYSHYINDLICEGTLQARIKAIRTLTIVKKYWAYAIATMSTDSIVNLVGIKNSFLFQNDKEVSELKVNRSSRLFTDAFIRQVVSDERIEGIKLSSNLNTCLCNDVLTYSLPSLLHNEDGNSMAFSIEARVPFMDYRIVEFALALDGNYKIKGSHTKWIVRKACRKYLPEKVYKRKSKLGFPAPFSRWIIEGKSSDFIKEQIFRFADRGIVERDIVETFYNMHIEKKSDNTEILFRFFCMELWMQMNAL